MAELERAVRMDGYRFAWSFLETHAIFEPLWPRADFQALVDYIRADMASQLEQLRMWEASEDRELVLGFTEGPVPPTQ